MTKALSLELLDNRYPSLHGLRVFAIISVVQYHVTSLFSGDRGIRLGRNFTASSFTIFFGMDLFFILSGFLIGSILLRSLEKHGTQNLKRFYIRRISRTFPPYYVVLTFLALTRPLTAAQRHGLPWEYLYGTNLGSLQPTDVVMGWGWSLALEEQFYLTVPILFFVLHRMRTNRARLYLLVALWLSALGIRLSIFLNHGPWNELELYRALYFRPHTRFDTLVAGLILALVHHRWGDRVTEWLKAPFHRALLGLSSLTCLWLLLQPWMFGVQHLQLMHVFAWGTVTSIMYFGVLLLLIHGDTEGWIHRFLSLHIFRQVATLGYGVYLVHIPLCEEIVVPAAHWLAAARYLPATLVWLMAITALMVLSLGVAYVMHVVIEKPSLRLRERLASES